MNVSAAQPTAITSPSADQAQLGKSCHEFEANLWQQVLDRALSPLLASAPGGQAPGAGVYTYFLSSTIAERVSGGPGSFSNLLQAQLSTHAAHQPASSTNVCKKAATP